MSLLDEIRSAIALARARTGKGVEQITGVNIIRPDFDPEERDQIVIRYEDGSACAVNRDEICFADRPWLQKNNE